AGAAAIGAFIRGPDRLVSSDGLLERTMTFKTPRPLASLRWVVVLIADVLSVGRCVCRHHSGKEGGVDIVGIAALPARCALAGIAPHLMRPVAPNAAPEELAPFEPIAGTGGRGVPAAQHDLWLWLHGTGPDVVLDGAVAARAVMAPVMTMVTEQPAFVYRDSRDMTRSNVGT